MAKLIDALFTSLLFIIPLIHLLISPHTKVEESFNIQAAHDILVYGTPTSNIHSRLSQTYDHFSFPGAVPRTFLGAVLLAGVGQPVVALVGFRHAQLVVRAVLGLFNAACLAVMRRRLRAAYGEGVARWWVVFMASQFHVSYYMSRTLPNMYAFGLVTLATAFLLPSSTPRESFIRCKQSIALLAISAVIFRSELAILLATTGLYLLYVGRVNLRVLASVIIGSSLAALIISVPIDSYFWQKPLWPELWGFYFNAIKGSSSDWGVSPWHYYFTSALPRLLLNPLLHFLTSYALTRPATTRAAKILTIPNLAFVAIYSIQPHKEARFIFYVVPGLTAAAALGANFIATRSSKSIIYAITTGVLVLSVLGSFAVSSGMLLLSALNYPGGDAINQVFTLADFAKSPSSVTVHADVLTCMTGLTRFGQNPAGDLIGLNIPSMNDSPRLIFDKTETEPELESPQFWNGFDYILMEDPSKALGSWEVVGVIQGYGGVEVLKPGREPLEVEDSEKVMGLGASVASFRETVRRYTGGWWIGPRMVNRIHILRKQVMTADSEQPISAAALR